MLLLYFALFLFSWLESFFLFVYGLLYTWETFLVFIVVADILLLFRPLDLFNTMDLILYFYVILGHIVVINSDYRALAREAWNVGFSIVRHHWWRAIRLLNNPSSPSRGFCEFSLRILTPLYQLILRGKVRVIYVVALRFKGNILHDPLSSSLYIHPWGIYIDFGLFELVHSKHDLIVLNLQWELRCINLLLILNFFYLYEILLCYISNYRASLLLD